MVEFTGRVRHWDQENARGLAVVDIPDAAVAELGGRRQARVSGTINGSPFTGSTMLVKGGGACVGVSKAALAAAGVAVGDSVQIVLP